MKKFLVILSVSFVLLNGIVVLASFFIKISIVPYLLTNTILFLLTAVNFFLLYNSFKSKNKYATVNAMFVGFIIKFVVIATAAYIYAKTSNLVDKLLIFFGAFVYFLYTFIELRLITKISKKQNA